MRSDYLWVSGIGFRVLVLSAGSALFQDLCNMRCGAVVLPMHSDGFFWLLFYRA